MFGDDDRFNFDDVAAREAEAVLSEYVDGGFDDFLSPEDMITLAGLENDDTHVIDTIRNVLDPQNSFQTAAGRNMAALDFSDKPMTAREVFAARVGRNDNTKSHSHYRNNKMYRMLADDAETKSRPISGTRNSVFVVDGGRV